MKYGLSDEDLTLIKNVFTARKAVERVIVFGSRALGTYKPGSDIDLAVVGETLTFGDILELHSDLEQLDTLFTFDIQRMAAIKDPEVLEHIKRAGSEFYIKKR